MNEALSALQEIERIASQEVNQPGTNEDRFRALRRIRRQAQNTIRCVSTEWDLLPVTSKETGERWVVHRANVPVPDDDPLDVDVIEHHDGTVTWEVCYWNGGDMAYGDADSVEQAKIAAMSAVPDVLAEIAAFKEGKGDNR